MKAKKIIKSMKKFAGDRCYRFHKLTRLGFYNWMPDKMFIKKAYKARLGEELNLENPQTFNEKLQWMKLYNRKPEYTTMVDKYAAKAYVAQKIGEEHIIPTLGVWDRFEDIDFDALPDQFVLKCTHDSAGLVICRDKSQLDIEKARKKINRSLKNNFYLRGREWPYKNVPHRIIAEKFMSDGVTAVPRDYKLLCFNGQPRIILVCNQRFSGEGLHEDFFDENWEKTTLKKPQFKFSEVTPEKPATFEEMKAIARKLAEGIPFVRVDLYEVDGKVYFGEMTFFPASGFTGFDPPSWDKTLGDWVTLPEKTV